MMYKKLSFVGLGLILAVPPCRADSSDNSTDDGTTKKVYYWQGNQINNLKRLTQGSPNFEEEQRKAGMGESKDQYLASIREQMAHQAAADAKTRNLLVYQGQLSGNPLEVSYAPGEVQVTLHTEMLFHENSTSLRIGAMDILDRLRLLLASETQKPVHLLISDRLDDGSEAPDLDADRTLMIAGLLEFPETDASQQENLSPEPLTAQ